MKSNSRKNNENIVVIIDAGVLKSGSLDVITQSLKESFKNIEFVTDVPPEPEEAQIREIFDKISDCKCDSIVSIGGGSVLDAAKILAVMYRNTNYYDDLTNKETIINPGVKLYCVPTSSGTGSEATPNSIILIPEKNLKVGVVHDHFMPDTVILDPKLTKSLPKAVTAATGLDAFCHCIETFISRKSNPFTELYAIKGLELISQNLRKAYDDGNDLEARANMQLAAFYGGVAISTSSTVAVHALSYPLGGTYRIPHGVSNAILLPYVMEFNADAILEKVPAITNAMGIDIHGMSETEAADKLIEEIFKLVEYVGIPNNLREFGITKEDIDSLTEAASKVTRLLDPNPKKMSLDDIKSIYKELI